MAKRLQPKLFLCLNTALLSFTLLLLFASPSWAQECKPGEIRGNIEQFKDEKVQQAARAAVSQCDKNAILPLAEALSHNDTVIRAQAAFALGTMGWTALDAVPDLVETLDDGNILVRRNAAQSLSKIARVAQQQAHRLSDLDLGAIQELETLKQQLEQALSRLEKDNKDWTGKEEARQELRLSRNALQTNLNYLKNKPLYQSVQWVRKNPWIWLVGAVGGYLGIFMLRPLWLLQLDKALQSQTVTIPMVNYQVPLDKVLIFRYRHRVLDAWVEKHLDSVKEEFFDENNRTVSDRKIHIPMPVVLNGKTLIPLPDANDDNSTGELEHKPLQRAIKDRILKERQVCLLIQGEGGAGKTSLACQIAWWGIEGKLSNHPMLPVLLEQELSEQETLLDAIRGQLQDLTDAQEEISTELLENLLREKRILVIVDRLSEMSTATREKIRPGQSKFPPINVLVVTSRLEDELPGVTKSILKPQRIEAERVSEFLGEYLKKKDKRSLFDDEDFLNACLRLSRMVGQRHTTILLARLYADQMIATQENAGLLPENIPELMLSYLNQLNRPVEAAKRRDNLAVHRDAEAVAWMCLQQTYRPTPAAQDTVLNALAEINPDETKERLNYIKDSLRLVQTVEPEDKISMVLDPLAEYLAGLYLVQQYRDDTEKWQKLLKEADNKPDAPKAIQGFLLALRDCCEVKQKEANIPSFVIEELTQKAGLDSEEIQKAQQKRRVRMLINDLSAPEPEYRTRAATDLGQMGQSARTAIPRLRKALEDESEIVRVRQEAAKALSLLGEEVPMLIIEIKDSVESLRLVEPPPTEKIDLGNGVILEMLRIPDGEFLMGAPAQEEESKDSERPQHLVKVAPFLMGKYPVTQAQWQAVAALPMVERELQPDPSDFKGEHCPVECVSWHDALEFCQRLSQHTSRDFRLPSEAEWEYACRAGTKTPFHFGETIITDLANYDGSSTYGSGVRGMNRRETTPVGMFQVANAFGLYDMHGNVWEWCADPWYENYQGAPTDGRVWEKDNDNQNQERLLRGGSYGSSPGRCRSACRNSNYWRDKHFNNIGFRVVCAAVWTL